MVAPQLDRDGRRFQQRLFGDGRACSPKISERKATDTSPGSWRPTFTRRIRDKPRESYRGLLSGRYQPIGVRVSAVGEARERVQRSHSIRTRGLRKFEQIRRWFAEHPQGFLFFAYGTGRRRSEHAGTGKSPGQTSGQGFRPFRCRQRLHPAASLVQVGDEVKHNVSCPNLGARPAQVSMWAKVAGFREHGPHLPKRLRPRRRGDASESRGR